MSRKFRNTAFFVHLGLFLLVSAGLAALDLGRAVPEGATRQIWFVWPLLGWGVLIAAHGLALLLRRAGERGGLLADRAARAVAVHLFAYVAANALLIAINLVETPGSVWFLAPLAGWGIGVALHAFAAYRGITRRTVERYAAEQRVLGEIQLEREVERQAAEIAAAVAPAPEGAPPPEQPAKKKPIRAKGKRPAKKKQPEAKPAAAARKGKSPATRKTASETKKPTVRKPAGRKSESSASRKPT